MNYNELINDADKLVKALLSSYVAESTIEDLKKDFLNSDPKDIRKPISTTLSNKIYDSANTIHTILRSLARKTYPKIKNSNIDVNSLLQEELLKDAPKLEKLADTMCSLIHYFFDVSYIVPYDDIRDILEANLKKLDSSIISEFKFHLINYTPFFESALLYYVDNSNHFRHFFDARLIADFINHGIISKDILFNTHLHLTKQHIDTLAKIKLQKDGKEIYFLSNDELIRLHEINHLKITSSDIINRNLSASDFDLGIDYHLFEENAFLNAFKAQPAKENISTMFFLLSTGYIHSKNLPDIYEVASSIDKEITNRTCLEYLQPYTLLDLYYDKKLTPEIRDIYDNLFESHEERVTYEKNKFKKLSENFGSNFALVLAFHLLDENLIMPESLKEYVNHKNASEIIEDYNLSPSNISKLYNAHLLTSDTLATSLTMEEIIEQFKEGTLQFNPETDPFNLDILDRNSVYMAHANGLVLNSDISPYIEKDPATPPKEYLGNLYTNQLVELDVLKQSFSENELLEMHVNGIIGAEIIGSLSEATTEEALHSKKISQRTVFAAYEKDIADLETLVSHQPEGFKLSRFVTSETPSSKVEELFLNDCLSYSELKQLEKSGIISSDTKTDIVSKYDINPAINKISQRASIKYNDYKPEHSIDPEELLITLGTEGIIPVTDDFNFAYIPQHNTGILYETTNYSNYIGTSNKTYVMELLDALETIKNKSYEYLPENYPYISATANYGTELLDSIHSIDNSFEYKSNPDISDYVMDIEVQVLGTDRED